MLPRSFNPSKILLLAALLLAIVTARATAGYTAIYAFGDGVCTTTGAPDPSPASLYFGKRYCNGPVWIEDLSALQGLSYNATINHSYFGQDSVELKANVTALTPINPTTALFIVWSANADFVKYANDGTPWKSSSLTIWNNKITTSIADQTTAITTLYNKGARVIVMPNAANVAAVPFYNFRPQSEKDFFRDRVISFNTQFTTAMTNLAASPSMPGLKIIRPDVFTFFEQVQANPTAYGMINPYPDNAAILDESDTSFTGPGANYVFWDDLHPTAKFQSRLADFVNPLIDNTPPVLSMPGDLVKEAGGPTGAVVTFTTSASDAVSGSRPTTATPASGSTFPVGTTTVNVSATDAAGNTASGSFKVTVVNMNTLLRNVTITPAGAGLPGIAGLIQGGPPGGQVILQASADLGQSDPWRNISTIALDAGGNQSFGPVFDPQGSGFTRDFFRIMLPLSP